MGAFLFDIRVSLLYHALMTKEDRNWMYITYIVIIILSVCIFVFFFPPATTGLVNPDEPKTNMKMKSVLSQEAAPQRIGILYTHQVGQTTLGGIPIQKYTFPGGGMIEAISMDGKKIISNSSTLILENED